MHAPFSVTIHHAVHMSLIASSRSAMPGTTSDCLAAHACILLMADHLSRYSSASSRGLSSSSKLRRPSCPSAPFSSSSMWKLSIWEPSEDRRTDAGSMRWTRGISDSGGPPPLRSEECIADSLGSSGLLSRASTLVLTCELLRLGVGCGCACRFLPLPYRRRTASESNVAR